MDWRQLWEIVSAPDNVPIVGLLFLIPFYAWYGLRQAVANDRLIALRFGAAAVRALDEGQNGIMVALDPPTVKYVPLADATKRMKNVPLDCDTMLTARDLGMCFGD